LNKTTHLVHFTYSGIQIIDYTTASFLFVQYLHGNILTVFQLVMIYFSFFFTKIFFFLSKEITFAPANGVTLVNCVK